MMWQNEAQREKRAKGSEWNTSYTFKHPNICITGDSTGSGRMMNKQCPKLFKFGEHYKPIGQRKIKNS